MEFESTSQTAPGSPLQLMLPSSKFAATPFATLPRIQPTVKLLANFYATTTKLLDPRRPYASTKDIIIKNLKASPCARPNCAANKEVSCGVVGRVQVAMCDLKAVRVRIGFSSCEGKAGVPHSCVVRVYFIFPYFPMLSMMRFSG